MKKNKNPDGRIYFRVPSGRARDEAVAVRINGAAGEVLRDIKRKTGMSYAQIASTIIIQSEDLIEFVSSDYEEDDDDEE